MKLKPEEYRNLPEEEIQKIWERFWDGDDSARFELHYVYMPLVEYFVRHFEKSIAKTADKDGLLSEAFMGLDEAIRVYRDNGSKFSTFASIKIRGAILDSFRASDWLPRGLRSLWRKCNDASDAFISEHHREPTISELSEILNTPESEIIDAITANDNAHTTHFDFAIADLDTGKITLGEILADQNTPSGDSCLEIWSLSEAMVASLRDNLDKLEQLVVLWKYIEGIPLVSIAERMGVSQTTVSAIHSSALEKLRNCLLNSEI